MLRAAWVTKPLFIMKTNMSKINEGRLYMFLSGAALLGGGLLFLLTLRAQAGGFFFLTEEGMLLKFSLFSLSFIFSGVFFLLAAAALRPARGAGLLKTQGILDIACGMLGIFAFITSGVTFAVFFIFWPALTCLFRSLSFRCLKERYKKLWVILFYVFFNIAVLAFTFIFMARTGADNETAYYFMALPFLAAGTLQITKTLSFKPNLER